MKSLTSLILKDKKVSTFVEEIVRDNLKRLMNTDNYEIYGRPELGLGLRKLLFSTDISLLEEYKNIIKNYIQNEIPYIEIDNVNFIPFYINEQGKEVIDYENYEYVVFEIYYKIANNTENFFEIFSKN